jgi:hypothetical protein
MNEENNIDDDVVTEEEIRCALRNYIDIYWRIFEKRVREAQEKQNKEEGGMCDVGPEA